MTRSVKRVLEVLPMCLCALVLGSPIACTNARAANDSTTVAEEHIRRVTAGLLIDAAGDGVYQSGTLRDRMAHYHTPGVSIAVVNDFKLDWARGFGFQQVGGHRKITPTTRFQAGSVSKPTFAVAVMRLVEKGTLFLDEDVNAYLTSWKVPPVGDWRPRVTLRQLFGHSAGFTVHGFPGYDRSQPVPTLVQVLDGAPPANSPPVRMDMLPGLQFRYSGGGVSVAELAVEDRTGRKLPALARELIFDRLGMRRSGYDQPLVDSEDVASGYDYPTAIPVPGRWHTYPELAAAGLWTTPSDLATLGISLQRALRGDADQVITPASAREMMTKQPIRGANVGIAFFIDGEGDSARFSHDGWDEGFLTQFVMYVQGGRGAVVMVNSTEGEDLIPEIMRAIAREYAWPGFLPTSPQPKDITAEARQHHVGDYVLEDGRKVAVTERADALWLALPDQPPLQLTSLSETSFFIAGLQTKVTFSHKDSGPPQLVIDQDGQTFKASLQPKQP